MKPIKPIIKRDTKNTDSIEERLEEYFDGGPIPASNVKVTIEISSPFPTLITAASEELMPIVSPESVYHIIEENFPNLVDNELDHNAKVSFQKQALGIMSIATAHFIKNLNSALAEYMPRSEDFKTVFEEEINKLAPFIDSTVSMDKNYKPKTPVDDKTKEELKNFLDVEVDNEFKRIVGLAEEE